ncbi:integrator complex subunit 14-like [Episyrphus balteatus]|uniref:integrator complex subunit 14-like n=1 Tax=Episyrphus balteatus TaxID=286459 RepID=UPI002485EDAD|nr:integrator complex subunit 14-like [Episyrphus balteatus]
MPTIIALDVSLSMQRYIPGRADDNAISYYQLAIKGINQFLEHLANNSKLEFVSYVTFSREFEVRVDFTRDYDQIRHAIKKQVHFDSSSLETLLKGVNDVLSSNWGVQNLCQVVVFTDCGLGFGSKSLMATICGLTTNPTQFDWLHGLSSTKLNFICMGISSEYYFSKAVSIYQKFIDVSGLKGVLFQPKQNDQSIQEDSRNVSIRKSELGRTVMHEIIELFCESSYKPFETILKCGGYFRMESPILIWPPPTLSNDQSTAQLFLPCNNVQICGYVGLSDIGSPASLSRHLIVPKMDREKHNRRSSDKFTKTRNESQFSSNELEKLESEIRTFYLKADGNEEDLTRSSSQSENQRESLCVLLHGALKIENMAALVLLSDNWFGFIYTFADSKKKSNLMLNVLPQGSNAIPWLGDLRQFGMIDDFLINETSSFPVKSEKRSYSQNFVIWIKQSSLQSDIQKVLRHAKKIPEKTQHFYKELNRIRRAALSIGFIELIEILASIFEREVVGLPSSTNPECTLQLKHSAIELRKTAGKDLKNSIIPLTSDFNP